MSLKETFKALGDPVRREILEMLKGGAMRAGDIAACFEMSQATVSYHLSQLKKADLVRETKQKNYIYYELNASVFEEILLWIKSFAGGTDDEEA
ncbi:MAG: ArsR family transcriptional regulator [Clostridia bacterium]|nr:autorepressor SdpR family transcription factor [Candidatus Pelethousia sp.]NCB30049.1 ArsR family transcriptional regulator [Clostridia bacterium]